MKFTFSKKKRKIFLTVSIILILIAIIPYIVLQFYKKDLQAKLEKAIDKNINATVEFDKLDFSFFNHFPNLTLSLQNVGIYGIDEFKGDTLANVKRIDLELKWFKLLTQGKTELKSISLNEPLIDVIVLKNGHANYNIVKADTTTKEATDTTEQTNIVLDKFIIKKGTIHYLDQTSNMLVEMDGIDHVGKGDFSSDIFDYSTETSINHFSFVYDNVKYFHRKLITVDLIMEMNLKSNTYTFKENTLGINKFIFGVNGKVAMLQNGYDLDISFASKETSFDNILSLVPGKYLEELKEITTDGLMQFSGMVKGKYIQDSTVLPVFHVDLNVKDAMFKIDAQPTAVKDIQFDLQVDNKYGILDSTIFDLRTFNMDISGHPIHGRFKVQGLSTMKIDADILAEIAMETIEKVYPVKGMDFDGKLNFELKAKGTYQAIQNKKSKKIQSIPAFHLNLALSDGKVKYDSANATFHDINLFVTGDNTDGNPEHTTIDLKTLQMYLGENPISGSMLLKGFESYYIKSDFKANINLADIEKLYPSPGQIMKGMFAADIKTEGNYNKDKHQFPVIKASVNLTNGYLKTADYPEPIENIHFIANAENNDGKPEDTRITINQLTYLMEGEPFAVTGFIEDMNKMNYDLKIKGLVDLEKLTKVYPVDGVKLKGIIDSDIEMKGSVADLENSNYSKTSCNGTVEITNFLYQSSSLPNSISISDAYFRLTPSKIILDRCKGEFGKSDFALTGDLSNYMYFVTANNDIITGDLTLTSDTLNLTEWVDTNTPSSSPSSSAASSSSSSSASSTAVWEVPKNVNFVFDSDLGTVLYEDVHITDMKGEITIKDGTLTLKETGFNSLNATFGLDAVYDTRDLKHPKFDLSLNIKELDINKAYKEIKLIRNLAPAAGDTYGKVTVSYKLAGELNKDATIKMETLVGGGNVTIANAKINGMKMFDEINKQAQKQEVKDPDLKDFSIDTEIRDNKLYVKPFTLKINGLNTDIEGYNNISGGTVNYLVKIEFIPIDKIKIPFHVTGTYDNPKVAMGKGKSDYQQ